jgi:hypothetical protein
MPKLRKAVSRTAWAHLIHIETNLGQHAHIVTGARIEHGLFLALRSNQKGGVDATNPPASLDNVALFLGYWVVNAFGCRTDYHNEAIG